jgi:hypothetical protein
LEQCTSVSKDGQFSNYLPESSEVFDGQLSEEADLFLTICNVEFNIKQKLLHKYWLVDFKRYDVDLKKVCFLLRAVKIQDMFLMLLQLEVVTLALGTRSGLGTIQM